VRIIASHLEKLRPCRKKTNNYIAAHASVGRKARAASLWQQRFLQIPRCFVKLNSAESWLIKTPSTGGNLPPVLLSFREFSMRNPALLSYFKVLLNFA
jgi:hypothetical protein